MSPSPLQGQGLCPTVPGATGALVFTNAFCGVSHSNRPGGLGSSSGRGASAGLRPLPRLRKCLGLRGQGQRDSLGSQAAQVVALAHEGFAFLEEVISDRRARVQGLEALAELVQLGARFQKHEQDAPVCGVVAVVIRVALYLQKPCDVSVTSAGSCQPPPVCFLGQTFQSTPTLPVAASHSRDASNLGAFQCTDRCAELTPVSVAAATRNALQACLTSCSPKPHTLGSF